MSSPPLKTQKKIRNQKKKTKNIFQQLFFVLDSVQSSRWTSSKAASSSDKYFPEGDLTIKPGCADKCLILRPSRKEPKSPLVRLGTSGLGPGRLAAAELVSLGDSLGGVVGFASAAPGAVRVGLLSGEALADLFGVVALTASTSAIDQKKKNGSEKKP